MWFGEVASGGERHRSLAHCHVIVCGNEKGGSGKSTIAMHVSVALAKLGFVVATLDVDTRQKTLTRYVDYRRRWIDRSGEHLACSTHFVALEAPNGRSDAANRRAGFDEIRSAHDFVIIDTPGAYTAQSVFAHQQADTLITPLNDSFIDFDVLANIDPETFEIQDLAQYAGAVRDARRERRAGSGEIIDWVVVRNRMSPISSRNERRVHACMRELSMKLGFRLANGIGERLIFREWFQRGLTALDDVHAEAGAQRLSLSHLAARNEVRRLIEALRLPVDDQGRRRAEARRQWLSAAREPIRIPDIFAS